MSGVLVLLGATATGKSRLALRLAGEIGAEIVNADALQVYRGLDIGTAKPSRAERESVPHHLIDLLSPSEPFSAGEFARRADTALDEITGRGRPAIVVGGSGLYLRALFEGLAPLPAADRPTRLRLEARLAEEGLPALRAELEAVDPETAARLEPGDTQRTLRALEVARSTGRPLSDWLARSAPLRPRRPRALKLGLTLPRSVLYDRIRSRVEQMVASGWLEEVRDLLASGVDPACPAFQAIGYSQWVRHLGGELSFDRAFQEIVTATRRYAKRQETWFRRETGVVWRDARSVEGQLQALARWVRGTRPWRDG
jgi:tRNA dimethylallyltransferase